jgi:hypothetical protein
VFTDEVAGDRVLGVGREGSEVGQGMEEGDEHEFSR